MTTEQFTAALAERVMGWKACPDRFIKSERGWIPRTRFQPLVRLEDAFLLLDRACDRYMLKGTCDSLIAELRVGQRIGRATGPERAATITLALARALQIETPE